MKIIQHITHSLRGFCTLVVLIGLVLPVAGAERLSTVHHQLQLAINPHQGSIDVRLHADLQISLPDTNALLLNSIRLEGSVPVIQYRIQFSQPSKTLALKYRGQISHPLSTQDDNYAAGRNSTPGLISSEGVFLGGSSYWYPQLPGKLLSFSLAVALPDGWVSLSQGEETSANHWTELQPQDDIYVIAAPFHKYEKETTQATAQVLLRQQDNQLAQRYLKATETYLDLFSRLLGDYPYKKFTLVENFWQSGYGMPSFTLLGSRVIRLPFILHSSYPHEILHNWWGNSVYVDYASGNWSEGLTSYLADHLLKEQQGKGAEYRRNSLQKYADYVAKASDFPLTEFVSHQGETSQAIGYSKALMMFHMLRKKLGDDVFIAGLRRFYLDNRFRFAGYADLRQAFERESHASLIDFFNQWTTCKGAPELTLDSLSVIGQEDEWHLHGRLKQTQPAAVFMLDIPVFVQLQESENPLVFNIKMHQRTHDFDLQLPARPLRISVDPRFELFRALLPEELPSSLGQLFAADEISMVLPAGTSAAMKKAWQALADRWQQQSSGSIILWDDKIGKLPENQAVWLLGRENRFLPHIKPALAQHGLLVEHDKVRWQGIDYLLDDHNLGLALARPGKQQGVIGFISASATNLPTLARKLPHYGRYSMTLFAETGVKNLQKIQWPLLASPLQVNLNGKAIPTLIVPALAPLIQ